MADEPGAGVAGGARASWLARLNARSLSMGIFLAILAALVLGFAWKYHTVALDFFRSEEPKVAEAAANLIQKAETAIQGAEAETTGQPEAAPSVTVSAAPAAATPVTPTTSPADAAKATTDAVPATTGGYHREVIQGGPGQRDLHVVTVGGDGPDRSQETVMVDKRHRGGSKGNGFGSAPYPYAYPPAPPQPPIPPDPNLPGSIVGALMLAAISILGIEIAGKV